MDRGSGTPQIDVALTFDFDGMSSYIALGASSPSMVSRGELGPIGVRRILGLLADFDARATFFVPGHTALAFPAAVRAVVEAGHEVGHHGWVHENPVALDRAQEAQVLRRGIEALREVTGETPVGYRSPAWDNSPHTVELLLEHGFEYESSMMGNDFEPYWCRVGDRWSKAEPFEAGTPVDLVELPVAWHLDDVPLLEYFHTSAGLLTSGPRPAAAAFDIWRGEFDYLYEHVGRGMLLLTMHPEVIGRGHRQLMLGDLLEHFAGHEGVRFRSCRDIARAWRQGKSPSLPREFADSAEPGR
jgi:peptidoglycan/xylan/chitin deacetylase (PgdA/CDA1 family)